MSGMADVEPSEDVVEPWEPGKPVTKKLLQVILKDAQFVHAGEPIRCGGKRSVLVNRNDQPVSGRLLVLGEELYNAVVLYIEGLP